MYYIKCISEQFKNEKEYALYKLKLSLRYLIIFPTLIAILLIVSAVTSQEWKNVFLLMISVYGIFVIILSVRYFILDRSAYNKKFSFNGENVFLDYNGNIKKMRIDKISSVILYENLLLIEWLQFKVPFILTLKIEAINEAEREAKINEFIKLLKNNCTIVDKSHIRQNI